MTDLTPAREWLAHDPDPSTREELAAVIEAAERGDEAALADLADRFAGPLTFGTAGLRGRVGAGENRMNVAVVTRATAGLAAYLRETVGEDARVVVGCDARHGSAEFYAATLEVLSGAGLTALALPPRQPTPVTAYAVRALNADAGVMVTASHNPPADNGYKVYLGGRASDENGNGVQIVPPADAGIAERIEQAPPADLVPRDRDRIEEVDAGILTQYTARMASHRTSEQESRTRVVLTPLHGVGGAVAVDVFAQAGVTDVHPVTSQFDPDPDFPTVSFPNPEEPGAIDLAIELAGQVEADVVVALDPDADRCSMAIPQPDGSWRQLTGDEIGALLGEQAAADAGRDGEVLASSIVSSRLLARIAQAHGLRSAATLTGFKWIARTPDIRFGYEEAIGYCTDPSAVRDKDGIGAAVRVVTLVEDLAARGLTVQDELDRMARAYGLYATAPLSIRVQDLSLIPAAMARLRAQPPTTLAGAPVVQVVDLAQGSEDLPPTDGLLLLTQADDRVIVRPSGTEPKLKCYLEVVLEAGEVIPRAEASQRLALISGEMREALGL
ncbi:phospho-sugar mutase [Serinibacter salmoneus]|uniref:Phosphomannomutase n=1 Tax=Serinibacter salmoneus TaxID=556530 RepID=A0A2A9CZV4_9MICO|nr:phospho-sugar mutase [Serinibacter salmoneus]PFG19923.1 phosphomannomutase [Serinibacter salmoneus]